MKKDNYKIDITNITKFPDKTFSKRGDSHKIKIVSVQKVNNKFIVISHFVEMEGCVIDTIPEENILKLCRLLKACKAETCSLSDCKGKEIAATVTTRLCEADFEAIPQILRYG